jgi:hypothetical protein
LVTPPSSTIPHLDPDTARDCPDDLDRLAAFATIDSGCPISPQDMEFVRTARIGLLRAWAWRFDADGDPGLAMVAITGQGKIVRSCLFEGIDLPAPVDVEQALLADFGALAEADLPRGSARAHRRAANHDG